MSENQNPTEQASVGPASREAALPFWRQLRWNLVLNFVLLAVLPMVIVVVIILARTSAQTTEQVINQLESVAELKRNQITRWLQDSRSTLNLLTASRGGNDRFIAAFTVATTLPDDALPDDIFAQDIVNNRLSDAIDSQFLFEEFFLYDPDGRIAAASNPDQIGKLVVDQPYFAPSLVGGVVQAPYYQEGRDELALFITEPLIDDQSGQTVGVLAGRLDLNTLGQIMTDRTGLRESGETYLVSAENNYLVTPSRFESEGYLLNRAYHSEGIDRALRGDNGSDTYVDYRDPPVPVIGVYRWIPELQAAMLVEVDQAEALAPFVEERNSSAVLAAGTALVALMVGLYIATRISGPITTLAQVVAQVAGGDLNQRAEVRQGNEIGLLATAFNHMTVRLRETLAGLEKRVQERTHALESSAAVSRQLTSILDLDELLRQVVTNIQNAFGYYHVHIYLIDGNTGELIIREGSGEVGQQLKAKGHKLQPGQGIVGNVARSGEPFLAKNVDQVPGFFRNPLLPKTRAELAVPLRKGDLTLGVLDMQSEEVGGFNQEDLTLMQSIADQVAAAVDNANLFRQAQAAIAEVEALNRRLTRDTWRDIGEKVETTGYAFTKSDVIPTSTDWLPAMTEAIQQKRLAHHAGNGDKSDDSQGQATNVAIPLTLRGEVIGVIGIERTFPSHSSGEDRRGGRSWSEDELVTIQTVTEQVTLALDAARLTRDTERAAWRDQVVSESTAKVWSSSELEEVMKAAVAQLGDKLRASEVVIRLGTEAELRNE